MVFHLGSFNQLFIAFKLDTFINVNLTRDFVRNKSCVINKPEPFKAFSRHSLVGNKAKKLNQQHHRYTVRITVRNERKHSLYVITIGKKAELDDFVKESAGPLSYTKLRRKFDKRIL